MTHPASNLAAQRANEARSLRIWPPPKTERFRFLVEAGMHSFSEIARLMDITKNAAIGKAQRLALKGPRMTGPAGAEPSTLCSRLDALNVKLDAVLAVAMPARVAPRVVTEIAPRRYG